MPFPMKIQPIDIDVHGARENIRVDSSKVVLKSRFKRLFDRQFPSVLKCASTEKPAAVGEALINKDGGAVTVTTPDLEPSSVCLAKMVLNFIEENNDRQTTTKCGRNRSNCFNGKNDSSDDEIDVFGGFSDLLTGGSSCDACDTLKCSITCASIAERNLLADTTMIVEKNKSIKRKSDLMKIITDELSSIGYDSSICKSKWQKSPFFPAGEYEYLDVIIEGERLLIDVDFRSEFEIARSTGAYKTILQSLPYIFVGKPDRVGQIVSIVSEAAKQSLKKKGLHFPPWRKAEYMRAKWLSPFTRTSPKTQSNAPAMKSPDLKIQFGNTGEKNDDGELELISGEKVEKPVPSEKVSGESDVPVTAWQPPAVKRKSVEKGTKFVTGLASLLKEKP